MGNDNTERMIKILVALFLFFAMITLIGFLSFGQAGVMGLIQNLMKWGGLTIVSVLLEFIVVIAIFKQRKIDIKTMIVFVTLAILCIVGVFSSFMTIKAFGTEKESIVCFDYELEYNNVIRSADKCSLIVKGEDGNTVAISITVEMYKKLSGETRPIKVTYYPYVNIVDAIEYVN